MKKKLDFITWLQRKGGIRIDTASADVYGLSFKESGFVGLVSKNGRGLDVSSSTGSNLPPILHSLFHQSKYGPKKVSKNVFRDLGV